LHMGEAVNLKSRTPSPARKEGTISTTVPRKRMERTPSPMQKSRDPSTDKAPPTKVKPRKPVETVPKLPSVKRTSSLRAKPVTAKPLTDGAELVL